MQNKLPESNTTNFEDSVVLITGAGGTIGSELTLRLKAKTIIAVDISEYAIYKLQRQIDNKNIHCIVGDMSDPKICRMIFDKYKINYVFNAAAYKHVDTLEDDNNTYSVIKNNLLTIINVRDQLRPGMGYLHISSDKAVNPTNNMGFTKLWGERLVQSYATTLYDVQFRIVRFGNIYNSSGSFVETLNWQMENHKPITITDPAMKRYFLTVGDAVSLINDVTSMAASHTYILDMGEEISIVDLVKDLSKGAHPVEYIGIRPGEKLREELVYDSEKLESTTNNLIKKISWSTVDMRPNVTKLLDELDKDEICIPKLKEIIETITI